jgi:hypothetical protein
MPNEYWKLTLIPCAKSVPTMSRLMMWRGLEVLFKSSSMLESTRFILLLLSKISKKEDSQECTENQCP